MRIISKLALIGIVYLASCTANPNLPKNNIYTPNTPNLETTVTSERPQDVQHAEQNNIPWDYYIEVMKNMIKNPHIPPIVDESPNHHKN